MTHKKLLLSLFVMYSFLASAQTINTFPHTEGFEDATDDLSMNFPNGWTIESNGTDSASNLGWLVSDNPGQAEAGRWLALLVGIPSVSLDEWLFTPEVQFQTGSEYRITFYYRTGANGGQPMRLHVGTDSSAAAMEVDPIWEDLTIGNSEYEQAQVIYTATSNDPVYFGFNVTSDGGSISQNILDTVSFELETLSVNDFNAVDFKISPNPTSDFFQITFPNSTSEMSLHIYDIQGKLVLQKKSIVSDSNIEINNLSSGVYIAKIFNDTSIISKKLIIE